MTINAVPSSILREGILDKKDDNTAGYCAKTMRSII